jgi:pyridoxine 5-phosphate synthase
MAVRLHVNVDHVATLRQARGTSYPDPVRAAALCEEAGADGITVHLREDRRHIQDDDVVALRRSVKTLLNLEMAATDAMVETAARMVPDLVTLVPEKREERTTEGGLDVVTHRGTVARAIDRLRSAGIPVSLFIDPEEAQVRASIELGARTIELHTGDYANTASGEATGEIERLSRAAGAAHDLSEQLEVAAGHGLTVENVSPLVARVSEIVELNIGHALVARAVMVGLSRAVHDFRDAIGEGVRSRP